MWDGVQTVAAAGAHSWVHIPETFSRPIVSAGLNRYLKHANPITGSRRTAGAGPAPPAITGDALADAAARALSTSRVRRVGIAADHGGFELKTELSQSLRAAGYEVEDFGAHRFDAADDYPDFIIPLARAVGAAHVERALALCGSGVGASIAANKVPGVRAALIHDVFSAHQGVEDDNMNILCLGGRVIGSGLALELIETFLHARFSGAARHERRLAKVRALETGLLEP